MPMPRWEAQLDKDKNCWFFHELSVDDPWILDSPGQAWNGFQLSQQLEQHLQSRFSSLI